MPSDTLTKFSPAETTKMPLVTLDPNKPKLLTTTNSVRSPNKRTTPPQSPPTPHKIELVDDETRRKTRSSEKNGVSSSSNDSETASTSSDDGIRFGRTSSVKKTLFQNGSSPAKAIRTSPRKVEAQETTTVVPKVVPTTLNNNKGPKKKLSFVDSDKPTNGSIKAFMPIRRSERRPKKNQTTDIIQKLKETGSNDSLLPLEVVEIAGKNRGVVPTKKISKGEFVVEYAGELIEHTTAEERENRYAMDISKGCYMYYFKTNGKHYCIDATAETGRLGRLVNHSRQHPNLTTKVIQGDSKQPPRLVLIAKYDIEPGTELLYDYGDRSKESLAAHPWLAK